MLKLTLVISFLTVISFSFYSPAQTQIIINEFSQGPSNTDNEWIELVVTADATSIKGIYFDDDGDLDTDGNIWNDVQVQLNTSYEPFANVSKGSIIVIYKGGTGIDPTLVTAGAPDTDFSDGKIIIPHTDPTYTESGAASTWPGLQTNGDAFGIFNADFTGIHGIAYGVNGDNNIGTWPTAFPSGTSWGITNLLTYNVNTGWEISFTEDTPEEVSTTGNWIVQVYDLASPGSLNGGNNNALPVELISFSALIKESSIHLMWRTETEVNNYGFEVQRSHQSEEWLPIGFVDGHGNSNSPKEYIFIDSDVNLTGVYYYRLKQIDNDGTHEFSKTIEVNFDSPVSFELQQNFPNPFNPTTAIRFSLPVNEYVSLKVFNNLGEEVETLFEGYLDAGTHIFNFSAEGLSSGMYIYRLVAGNDLQSGKMLLMK